MSDAEPRLCNKCGYDLTGHRGLRGTCPECGGFWDAMSGRGLNDMTDEGRRKSASLVNRLRTILLGLLVVCIMICGGLGSLVAKNPWRPITLAAVLAAVALLAAITSYVYEDDP